MADFDLQIVIDNPDAPREPGSELKGQVVINSQGGSWEADSIDLSLFWRTSGIGTQDAGEVASLQLCEKGANIPAQFAHDFSFTLPLQPYTYYGKLIKVTWNIGLYVRKGWLNNPETEITFEIRPRNAAGRENDVNTSDDDGAY